MTQRCGVCEFWDRENKRNCSTPATPLYYAECKYPFDELKLPHCIMIEGVHEYNGVGCPCFQEKKIG